MGDKPTISISHLGCEKNRIDTEHMLGLLVQAGYQVDSNEDLADYVIVNTCSFIQAAREESVRTLVELAEENKKIVITGCMAQHFQQELLEAIPEAVAVVGTGDYHKIVDVIQRAESGERVKEISTNPTYIADETTPRYRTTTAVRFASFPICEVTNDRDRLSRSWPKLSSLFPKEFRRLF
jgi:ribosomal protein S12 methylthiotransferase